MAEEVVLTWRDKEATLVDALVAAVVPATDEEVLKEDEEMALWCTAITERVRPYKASVPLLKGKSVRGAHVSATLPNNEQLRHQFEQFQMFQQQQNTHAQFFSFSTTLAQTGTPISYLTSSISYTWIMNSGATGHITGN